MGGKMEGKRLYVGNLYPDVTQDELKEKFDKFGSVDSAEVKHKTDIDGNKIQTFGFVNLQINDDSLRKCIAALSNKDWKGYQMRVQQAKESFMSRLQKERQGKGTDNGDSLGQGRNQEKVQDVIQDKVQDRSQVKVQDRKQNKFQPNPRISDLDHPYDPLALFKSKLATDGIGETSEEKKVSKHLGGNKKDPIRKTKQSGNFQKLGDTENVEGKEPEHDAFQMFKQQLKPAETEKPKKKMKVDKGKVIDGVVTFSEGNNIKKGRKRKIEAYHSSDEEEGEDEVMKRGVKSSPNKITFARTFENEGKENKMEKEKTKESNKRQKTVQELNQAQDSEEEEYNADDEKKRNYEILNKVVAKEAEWKKPRSTGKDYMPRFDPTATTVEKINKKTENSTLKWNRGYDTIPDLKSVFKSSSSEHQGTGFSFSFNTQSQPDTSLDDKKPGKSLFKLDTEDQDEKLVKKSMEKFGVELMKIDELPPFFFGTEDLRNKDSMDFFFDYKPDIETVKNTFYEKRRSLKRTFQSKEKKNKPNRKQGGRYLHRN